MAVSLESSPRARLAASEAAVAASRAQLGLVPPVRHHARYWLLLLVLVAVEVFGVVSLGALAAESAFEAQQLEAEVTLLTTRYDELTVEVAALKAPERVLAVARTELGMVPAGQPGFLHVGEAASP